MNHHGMESQRRQLYQTGTAVGDGVRLISITIPTSLGVTGGNFSGDAQPSNSYIPLNGGK